MSKYANCLFLALMMAIPAAFGQKSSNVACLSEKDQEDISRQVQEFRTKFDANEMADRWRTAVVESFKAQEELSSCESRRTFADDVLALALGPPCNHERIMKGLAESTVKDAYERFQQIQELIVSFVVTIRSRYPSCN